MQQLPKTPQHDSRPHIVTATAIGKEIRQLEVQRKLQLETMKREVRLLANIENRIQQCWQTVGRMLADGWEPEEGSDGGKRQ
jgi:hypothetical protein